jgi:hypothetical protein
MHPHLLPTRAGPSASDGLRLAQICHLSLHILLDDVHKGLGVRDARERERTREGQHRSEPAIDRSIRRECRNWEGLLFLKGLITRRGASTFSVTYNDDYQRRVSAGECVS